jgi:hypothetical protein
LPTQQLQSSRHRLAASPVSLLQCAKWRPVESGLGQGPASRTPRRWSPPQPVFPWQRTCPGWRRQCPWWAIARSRCATARCAGRTSRDSGVRGSAWLGHRPSIRRAILQPQRALLLHCRCPTPRDFVPWCISDAGPHGAGMGSSLPASEMLHTSGHSGAARPAVGWPTSRRRAYNTILEAWAVGAWLALLRGLS